MGRSRFRAGGSMKKVVDSIGDRGFFVPQILVGQLDIRLGRLSNGA